MRICDVGAPIYIGRNVNHNVDKGIILNLIDSMGKYSVEESHQRIKNTDYYMPNTMDRKYWPKCSEIFQRHWDEMDRKHFVGLAKTFPVNFWFQQYQTGDYHGWHLHPSCLFSNVYYVELSSEGSRTTFLIDGKEISIEVSEGDIISFPTSLLHCSKPNKNGRKTVIVANTNALETQ